MVREILRGSSLALTAGFAGGIFLGAAGCGEVAANPDAGDPNGEDDGGSNGGGGNDGGNGDADASADPDARADCDAGFTGADCDECTVFVDGEEGDDGQVGLSWDDAVASVAAGIGRADTRIGAEDVDRCSVWVREGIYLPGEDRSDAFELAPDVHVYGGFAGFEATRDERNFEQYESVLSGDLAQDDANGEDNVGDNAYHVVIGADDAILDGFTITSGNADGASDEDGDGAGIYNADASPTLRNLVITENQAGGNGGGMINLGASTPSVSNVSFTENQADVGGAMYNTDSSAASLTDVSFTGNQVGSSGGAVYNQRDSAPSLTNVSFTGNQAEVGGAMFNDSGSAPSLTNVSFADNQAGGNGGAIANSDIAVQSPELEIYNAIFWGNGADGEGEDIHHDGDEDLVIQSSIVAGGEGGITGNGTVVAENLVTENPEFVNAPDDLRLESGSPAIDEGDESVFDALGIDIPDTDLGGDPRLVDGESGGEGPIDFGAFEYQPE